MTASWGRWAEGGGEGEVVGRRGGKEKVEEKVVRGEMGGERERRW